MADERILKEWQVTHDDRVHPTRIRILEGSRGIRWLEIREYWVDRGGKLRSERIALPLEKISGLIDVLQEASEML